MKDTVKSLMESAVTPHMDSATKNRIAFSGLRSISEAAADIIRFTPQKVVVDKVGENYVMRYSANVERLMEEQNMKLSEAVECVANINGIRLENCILIFDEASINSDLLDIQALVSGDTKFQIGRM